MEVELTNEARARLDAHLDAVEQALTNAGNNREHRRAVLDDLEAQILDMLAARGNSPTVIDVEAVLGTLDPPSAYHGETTSPGVAAPPAPPSMPLRPRYSRTAIWGLVCILASFLPVIILVPLVLFFHASRPVAHSVHSVIPESVSISHGCVLVLIGPLGILGTVLGWVASGQIRASKGAIRGKGLALFDGLFYPVLAGLFLLAAVFAVA